MKMIGKLIPVWVLTLGLYHSSASASAVRLPLREPGDAPVASVGGCFRAPKCLEPMGECLPTSAQARAVHIECKNNAEFCNHSVYKLPTTGVKITLPVMATATLDALYKHVYSSQGHLGGPKDPRPTQQAEMVNQAITQGINATATGLTIVEMGCAAGYLLYNLRWRASGGGSLTCFEADPDLQTALGQTMRLAEANSTNLKTTVLPQLFDAAALGNESVDVFLSSQVLEHLPSPCQWLADLHRILKPGGIVFTEVPEQYMDQDQGLIRRGTQFHLLYFNLQSFDAMMTQSGFETVRFDINRQNPDGAALRSIYRKPVR